MSIGLRVPKVRLDLVEPDLAHPDAALENLINVWHVVERHYQVIHHRSGELW